MSISNLTNTVWLFGSDKPYYRSGNNKLEQKSITFTSNGNTYSSIKYIYQDAYADELYYGSTMVFHNEDDEYVSWVNSAYRKIRITGGNDVTNSTLITWLETNATLTSEQEIFEDNMNALADSINTKAGTTGQKTITELTTAVNSIPVAKVSQTKTEALSMASGNQVITPDTNKVLSQVTITKPNTLVAGNIKTGVTIGGVQGTYTNDATATAGDILNGYTGYVNGSKITGNIQSQAATTYNTSSSNQTIAQGKYLSGVQTIKAVTTSNIVAANVVNGATIKVGDANDDDRILIVNGTAPSEEDMYAEMNSTAYGTPSYTVRIIGYNSYGQYRVNNGSWTNCTTTETTLTDVYKLEIQRNTSEVDTYYIYDSNNVIIHNGSLEGDIVDVTQYLQNNCLVKVWED